MPTIEERALALVNEATDSNLDSIEDFSRSGILKALFNSLEDHDATLAEFEAFKREVSDAVEDYYGEYRKDLMHPLLRRFILPKPVDPLVHLAREMVLLDGVVRTDRQKAAIRDGRAGNTAADDFYDRLRTALPARGLKLVEVGDGD